MRFPSFPAVVRAFYALSNTTARRFPLPQAPARRLFAPTLKYSMPTIPFLGSLFSSSSSARNAMSYPVQKTDEEWRAVLSPEQFRVLRKQGTEAPFSGEYDKHQPAAGTYNCAGCDAPLYTAQQKFKSGCGWPAFYDTVPGAVVRHTDNTLGMQRTEIVCANCGGHLGHVFKGEGYPTPTDERHCVNSVSLRFKGEGEGEGEQGKKGE
ncbi:Major facilitator superfamily [Macrophomina phaseolina MS6]|uniref:Peptide-methionine (R)-S-oxide reductase n=2 Tax=Macrophomina phaseolina TaxID=35725 RepID=K2S4X4_MACPH|nr:Major facilitator superfamily [Macrophomina phaseolina MS6]KAH7057087.1 methionine-R-sulfoxide reductase-like protein SelR [Macrophomina phaseolina]